MPKKILHHQRVLSYKLGCIRHQDPYSFMLLSTEELLRKKRQHDHLQQKGMEILQWQRNVNHEVFKKYIQYNDSSTSEEDGSVVCSTSSTHDIEESTWATISEDDGFSICSISDDDFHSTTSHIDDDDDFHSTTSHIDDVDNTFSSNYSPYKLLSNKKQKQSLKDIIAIGNERFRKINVASDGDCAPSSLRYFLKKHQSIIRKEVVDTMREHYDTLNRKYYFSLEELDIISRSGEYNCNAMDAFMEVASLHYKVCIKIYNMKTITNTLGYSYRNNQIITVILESSHYSPLQPI